MKPKNFPARKLIRQLKAKNEDLDKHKAEIENARAKRTKKQR